MTRRLKLMLAVLAAIATLLVLDRPPETSIDALPAKPNVPSQAMREPAPRPVTPPLAGDVAIPDLFAHPVVHASAPQPAAGEGEAEAPGKPFKLVGFRTEGALREAYLLRSADDTIATVRAGDTIDRRYRVLAVGGASVDIKDKTSGATIRIGFEDPQ